MAVDWTKETVLVTGGTGMIGANLVRRLVADGAMPFLAMRTPERLARIADLHDRVRLLTLDIVDAPAVAKALAEVRPTVVFHLASSFFNPPTLSAGTHMAVNATGTLNLCEGLRNLECRRFVYAGSCAVYRGGSNLSEETPLDPGSIFGVSKAAAALAVHTYARLYKFPAVELRIFTAFGPWENARRIIPHTILSALEGRNVEIGNGTPERDLVYMDDIVDAFVLAAEKPLPPGLVLNLGSGTGRPIRDVVARVLALMGTSVQCRVNARATRPDEIWQMSANISATRHHLGWSPQVDFDEGLRRTIRWFTENRGLAAALT